MLNHLYVNTLYMLEEDNCYLLCSKAEIYAPMLESNNISYIAQNRLSVTILQHFVYRWFVYRWLLNITAEF